MLYFFCDYAWGRCCNILIKSGFVCAEVVGCVIDAGFPHILFVCLFFYLIPFGLLRRYLRFLYLARFNSRIVTWVSSRVGLELLFTKQIHPRE